jgi:tetratricopeptide (TPR) repeat protein
MNKEKRKLMPFLLFTILLFFPSCSSNKMILKRDNLTYYTLIAKVFNGENRACDSVHIHLRNGKRKEYNSYTDVTGRAIFQDLDFGSYHVELSKKGYESIAFDFEYLSEGQSLYGKLYSAEQLLRMGRKKMDLGEWEEALSFIERAEKIEKEEWEILFLKAIILWKQERIEEAGQLFLSLNQERLPAAMLLFYGDLLQYDWEDPERAYQILLLVNKKQKSIELKTRLEQLKIQIEKDEDNENTK